MWVSGRRRFSEKTWGKLKVYYFSRWAPRIIFNQVALDCPNVKCKAPGQTTNAVLTKIPRNLRQLPGIRNLLQESCTPVSRSSRGMDGHPRHVLGIPPRFSDCPFERTLTETLGFNITLMWRCMVLRHNCQMNSVSVHPSSFVNTPVPEIPPKLIFPTFGLNGGFLLRSLKRRCLRSFSSTPVFCYWGARHMLLQGLRALYWHRLNGYLDQRVPDESSLVCSSES